MVAKGLAVAHGGVLMNYILTKEKARLLRLNHLGEERDPDRIWTLMQLHQMNTRNLRKANHKIDNYAVEFEISPSGEESRNWKLSDFDDLLDEFIAELNRIDLSGLTKRMSSKHFDLDNTQFIAAVHYDSTSGLPHIHIGANRIDMNGQALDCHKLGERILQAVHNINVRHGWELPEDIHKDHLEYVNNACMEALKRMSFFDWSTYGRILAESDLELEVKRDSTDKPVGYVIWMGNSKFKASDLGKSRNLTVKNIQTTWQKLHLMMEKKRRAAEMKTRINSPIVKPAELVRPARYTAKYEVDGKRIDVDILKSIYDLFRNECHVPADNDVAKVDDVVKVAVLLFIGYVDAATSIAKSCGGGGGQPESGWGKKRDEDEREWARRCVPKAHRLCTPGPRIKYGFRR